MLQFGYVWVQTSCLNQSDWCVSIHKVKLKGRSVCCGGHVLWCSLLTTMLRKAHYFRTKSGAKNLLVFGVCAPKEGFPTTSTKRYAFFFIRCHFGAYRIASRGSNSNSTAVHGSGMSKLASTCPGKREVKSALSLSSPTSPPNSKYIYSNFEKIPERERGRERERPPVLCGYE